MSQHVVFFGIDGAQLSRIRALHNEGRLPDLDRFFLREAFTGGNLKTPTQQGTNSGPGWSTLLTGTWVDKHGVTSNNKNQANAGASSLFERIDAGMPGADIRSFVEWKDINEGHFKAEMAAVVDQKSTGTDAQNLQKTLSAISAGQAEFVFQQYSAVDNAGHANGFGAQYDQALISAIQALGQVLTAIEAREAQHPSENWLLIASTDHGRNSTGLTHGGQSASERQSFILSSEAINTSATPVAVTSVATTILDFLNIGFNMNSLVSQSILIDGDPNNGTNQTASVSAAVVGSLEILPASSHSSPAEIESAKRSDDALSMDLQRQEQADAETNDWAALTSRAEDDGFQFAAHLGPQAEAALPGLDERNRIQEDAFSFDAGSTAEIGGFDVQNVDREANQALDAGLVSNSWQKPDAMELLA